MPRRLPSSLPWLFPLIALGVIYFYLSTRYAIWNFDDVAFYGLTQRGSTPDLGYYFLGKDLPNEYRTYSLSRVLQLQLMAWSGSSPYPLFAFMALIHIGSASLIYGIVKLHAQPVHGISSDALGCALIWLFSPFSIVGTFHHFSYLLLPFFFLFSYILMTEDAERLGGKAWYHFALVAALVGACLTGETVIAPLLAYISVKVFQRKCWRIALVHGLTVVCVLVAHYLLLRWQRPKGMSGQRFKSNLPDLVAMLDSIHQFLLSVGSAILQGIQVSTISYDPYYPGLVVHSFVWQNLSAGSFAFSVATFGLIYVSLWAGRPAAPASSGTVPVNRTLTSGFVLAASYVMAASWALYVFMVLAGTRLYGNGFTLQVRYGYVVLPLSGIVAFLLLRRLPVLGQFRPSAVAWCLPIAAVVFWLGSQLVANATGAEETKNTINQLRAAKADGVVIVSRVAQNWAATTPVRPYGLMNPFVRWGDTPLQQDWTAASYLLLVVGLEVGQGPFLQWNERYALQVLTGSRPVMLPLDGKYARLSSRAPESTLRDYPRDDLQMSVSLIGKNLIPIQQELLSAPQRIGPTLRLERMFKAVSSQSPADFVFVWNDLDSAAHVFIHFLDAAGKMVHQADHAYVDTVRLQLDGPAGEGLRLRIVEMPSEMAGRVASIVVGAYTLSPADGHGVTVPVGTNGRGQAGP